MYNLIKGRISIKNIFNLAGPHTWVASIMPVLLSYFIVSKKASGNYFLWTLMLIGCILLQSAVNTLNDYSDFKRGTDTSIDYLEASDAVLLHNNIPLESVRLVGILFIASALICGILPIFYGGLPVLIIGILGVICVFCYSLGPLPLYSIPVGELVSGVLMGGLIPLATTTVINREINLIYILYFIPTILGISAIMMTNNICDIDKDKRVSRKTLAVSLGYNKAIILYRSVIILWLGYSVFSLFFYFSLSLKNIPVFIFTTLVALLPLTKQIRLSLVPKNRIKAMKGIVILNWVLGLWYSFWIMLA